MTANTQVFLRECDENGGMESRSERVLVVDDEPNIADLVATALRYEGFEVRTGGSGRAALDGVEAFRPDLVVLDIMLPDLDGFEVARRLRQQDRKSTRLNSSH